MPAFPSIIIVMFCAGGALASGGKYIEVNPDSLRPFTNLVILSDQAPLKEDSAYCTEIEMSASEPLVKNGKDSISLFKCGPAIVSEFTFAQREGEYMHLLFKPRNSGNSYFGRMKIKRTEIRKAYAISTDEKPESRMTEKGMDRLTGGVAVTAIVILGLAALYLIFFESVSKIF